MSGIHNPKTNVKPFVSLEETVVIGYTDIAAAGCRVLLGVSGQKTEVPFEVPGISTPPCCSPGDTAKGDLKPFVVYNCNYMLIEGIAFSCLFCPANKAEPGNASDYDGSLEVIATMQEYLGDITLLGFSLDNSKALIYSGDADENTEMVARIYV